VPDQDFSPSCFSNGRPNSLASTAALARACVVGPKLKSEPMRPNQNSQPGVTSTSIAQPTALSDALNVHFLVAYVRLDGDPPRDAAL
jgi:hypothetical protein